MKKLLKSILVLLTALSLLLTGCGLANEVGSAVKDTVTGYVEEKAGDVGEILDTIPDREPVTEIKSQLSDYLKGESSGKDSSSEDVSTYEEDTNTDDSDNTAISEDEWYSDKDSVALYLHTFGHLPGNYIKKNDAKDAGWDSGAGNLNLVLPGMSIGGDKFGNREGKLPTGNGLKYYECDINYNAEGDYDSPVYRGAERIIYSNQGDIYYTNDHYETFEKLY